MSLGHAHAINKGKQGNFAVDDLGLFTLSVLAHMRVLSAIVIQHLAALTLTSSSSAHMMTELPPLDGHNRVASIQLKHGHFKFRSFETWATNYVITESLNS